MLNGYIWWIRFVKYSNPYAFEAHDIFQIHQYGPVKECKIQAYAGVSIDLDVCVCVCVGGPMLFILGVSVGVEPQGWKMLFILNQTNQ